MGKTRDTYKYYFKKGNRIVHGGITDDLDRREQAHKQKSPRRLSENALLSKLFVILNEIILGMSTICFKKRFWGYYCRHQLK